MTTIAAPFGQLMTAMITPMTPDGAADFDGAARLAEHLVTAMRNDGIVVNGTTGEAPVTTDAEKEQLIRVVRDAVGSRAAVVAGVGTNVTEHTVRLARDAERAGADGLLVVTPYYSKPPQAALAAHFTTVADATGLPVLIYDIPGRTGMAVGTETLIGLARHPRIIGVKDAKEDVAGTSRVLAETGLAYYCGTDMVNLPWLALGAVGFVSVAGHVAGDRLHEMIDSYGAGDVEHARQIHYDLLPVYTGLFRNQAAVLTKAALELLGLPGGPVRGPLLPATEAERRRLAADLAAGGVKVPARQGTGIDVPT